MRFPEGKPVSSLHRFSGAILERSLKVVFKANREFSGYLRIRCDGEGVYFLFFLKNDVWACGKYFSPHPAAMTVQDFFREVTSRSPEGMWISLHETEPLLLKEFLVFFHLEPTVKAPVNLIDLQAIAGQIAAEQTDALVVLESGGSLNFFSFRQGQPAEAHLSETADNEEGLGAEERMLLYAYRPGSSVDAYIYRNLPVDPVPGYDVYSQAEVISWLHEALAPAAGPPPPAARPAEAPQTQAARTVTVTVAAGVARGTVRVGSLPFTIGRKEGNLIIDDKLISRRHAVIREIDGALVVEDLESANGTFVNGVEVKLHQLAPGDRVALGGTVLLIAPGEH